MRNGKDASLSPDSAVTEDARKVATAIADTAKLIVQEYGQYLRLTSPDSETQVMEIAGNLNCSGVDCTVFFNNISSAYLEQRINEALEALGTDFRYTRMPASEGAVHFKLQPTQ
jgi:hypothetical protein